MSVPFQLFDALDPATEVALRASIQRFGVLVPVVRDQHGNTIDGHHRARIADELGVPFRVDVMAVTDEDEAREIARTLNADRRQLDPDRRQPVVADLIRQGHSTSAVAKALGTSQSTVDRDVQQLTRAGKLERPETSRGLDGRVRRPRRPPVVAAKNEREAQRAQAALGHLGDAAPERVLDVKRAERIAREHAAEQRRQEPVTPVTSVTSVTIHHGDFRQVLADIEPGSVDAIITDPPYPDEFIPLFADLSALAARVLRPSGVLAVMTGGLRLPRWLGELSKHMRYRWTGAYIVQGPRSRVHAAKVANGWKPILIYQRHDAADLPFILDDLFDSAGDDKRFHHWGQSESGIAALVDRLSAPGAMVVDPFLGGGTTAVVCRDLGRRFVGCDIDAAAVSIARERTA